jgi:hypothetical protein
MKTRMIVLFASAALLGGCFVCSESEFPKVAMTALSAGKSMEVQLTGFEAMVTSYVPIYGYETVFASRPVCRRRSSAFYSTTYATQTYIPQSSVTTVFAERAADAFEKGGFVLAGSAPKYRVEVKFGGPYVSDSDNVKAAMWSLFTVFTAGYGTQSWSAKLKVYEIASGRLVYHKDYSQRYEAIVWGPLPIFSPSGSETISHGSMQSWCLSALTDCAVTDAMAFLGNLPQ